MKKAALVVMICSLFITLRVPLLAADQKSIDGLFLFIELEIWNKAEQKIESFGATVDFHGMLEQPKQPRGLNGPARKICEQKIYGFDYSFWIEPGSYYEKSNSFRFSVAQSRDGEYTSGANGLVSVEAVREYDAPKVFGSFGGNPIYYVRVHAITDVKSFLEYYGIGPHKDLNCFYPTYKYPKASP